jgi:hypothetical protein
MAIPCTMALMSEPLVPGRVPITPGEKAAYVAMGMGEYADARARGETVSVREEIGPWNYELTFDGPRPVELHITLDPDRGTGKEQITVEVLRQFPMEKLKRDVTGVRLTHWTAMLARVISRIPDRMRTKTDYAYLSAAYVILATELGHSDPIATLANFLHIDANTVSRRVQRARDYGILEGGPAPRDQEVSWQGQKLLAHAIAAEADAERGQDA